MDMASKIFLTEISIKAFISKENLMDLESISGPMALLIEDTLQMDWDRDKEHGQVIMVINMLVISVMIVRMVLENTSGQMAIAIREISVKIWEKGKDKCIGMMEVYTLDSGKEDYLMEKVHIALIKLGTFKVKG